MNTIRPTDAALVIGQTMNAIGVRPGTDALSTAVVVLAAVIVEAAHGDKSKIKDLIEASSDALTAVTEEMREKVLKGLDS